MKTMLAAIGLLTMGPAHAHADWEYARWGMTPEQVVAASQGAAKLVSKDQQITSDELKLTTKVETTYTAGQLKLQVKFAFNPANGLAMIGYETQDPTQGEALKAWLVQRYGPPQITEPPLQGTSAFYWKQPDDIMLNVIAGAGAFVMQSK